MNKCLRQILIGSRVPTFVRMGYRDVREKFHARYHAFQDEIKESLKRPFFEGRPYSQSWLWMKRSDQ